MNYRHGVDKSTLGRICQTAYEDLLAALNKHCRTNLSLRVKRAVNEFEQAEVEGARCVLSNALEVGPDDTVVIVSDETSMSAASCILQVAMYEVGANSSIHLVSTEEQRLSGESLPSALKEGIDDASAVIVLGSSAAWGTAFRFALFRYAISDGKTRIATLPGATTKSLQFSGGVWSAVAARTQRVSAIIARAAKSTLVTTDGQNNFSLVFDLGHYRPREFSGKVAPGSWGNVPAGESFVLPNRGTCKGKVAINGSLPNYEVVAALSKLIFDGDDEIAPNATMVAEIGVGLNQNITSLNGVPFLDQKALGVVHIGLGADIQFGGPTYSTVHIDLITRPVRLSFDDKIVIMNGKYIA